MVCRVDPVSLLETDDFHPRLAQVLADSCTAHPRTDYQDIVFVHVIFLPHTYGRI
jgi:hypothetical protein